MVWENYGLNFTDEILWIPDSIAYRASWTKFQNTIQNQSGWWFQHVLKNYQFHVASSSQKHRERKGKIL
jgi:hypothetical protein